MIVLPAAQPALDAAVRLHDRFGDQTRSAETSDVRPAARAVDVAGDVGGREERRAVPGGPARRRRRSPRRRVRRAPVRRTVAAQVSQTVVAATSAAAATASTGQRRRLAPRARARGERTLDLRLGDLEAARLGCRRQQRGELASLGAGGASRRARGRARRRARASDISHSFVVERRAQRLARAQEQHLAGTDASVHDACDLGERQPFDEAQVNDELVVRWQARAARARARCRSGAASDVVDRGGVLRSGTVRPRRFNSSAAMFAATR